MSTYPAPTPPHPSSATTAPVADTDLTPQREMNVVIDRIQQLENDYRNSIAARNARLQEQQERYSDLQSVVESQTKKYRIENKQLRAQLRKSEHKQAVLARRLAQALHERNEDDASHLKQLVTMHNEQIATMQEGMRELLNTLGVEESVIGNLEQLCGVAVSPAATRNSNNHHDGEQQQQPTENILYGIRRQNCELAIALRKAISIVREKLDVEENARIEAQQKAADALDAALVVDQALQKAGAVLLKEEATINRAVGKIEAVSVTNTSSAAGASFAQHSFHAAVLQQQQQQQIGGINQSSSPPNASHASLSQQRRSGGGALYPPTPDEIFRARSISNPRIEELQPHQQQGYYHQHHSPTPHSQNTSSSALVFTSGRGISNSSQQNGGGGVPPPLLSTAAVTRLSSSLAVLKDIVFGSLDVVRDIEKIVGSGNATNDKAAPLNGVAGINQSSTAAGAAGAVAVVAVDPQLAVDRARAAERAIAGQALLELRREVDAHQHTRAVLQRKVAFLTSEYEKLLQYASTSNWEVAVAAGVEAAMLAGDDGDDGHGTTRTNSVVAESQQRPQQQEPHLSATQLQRHTSLATATANHKGADNGEAVATVAAQKSQKQQQQQADDEKNAASGAAGSGDAAPAAGRTNSPSPSPNPN